VVLVSGTSVAGVSCGAVAGEVVIALSPTSRVEVGMGCEELGAADIESVVAVVAGPGPSDCA
jgi:hypothetical protein